MNSFGTVTLGLERVSMKGPNSSTHRFINISSYSETLKKRHKHHVLSAKDSKGGMMVDRETLLGLWLLQAHMAT